ncbi:MAG: histidine--tRNA ligase [Christensenellaceae bacterium]|jgi:histidyl-tRNA synthetase|nr:histidine--tRNA ligase [Christensenellaceae bacterium]
MINIPKGTKDTLPQDSYKWQYVESTVRRIANYFGFREIRTPTFEYTELFLRGVGESTDIVDKEMYTFNDKGNRSISLRPEGTAGVARSYIENSLENNGLPVKMYYIGPAFRYERPQSGRLREHHQFGAELYGSPTPYADAQIISMAKMVLDTLGLQDVTLNINSIGCPKCRPNFDKAVRSYFETHIDSMCEVCKERLVKNPLRILDCKVPSCATIAEKAPSPADFLCDECASHQSQLINLLTDSNLEFKVNRHIVRGLDYYTKTVFEFVSTLIGAQGTVCGGGRYDNLTASLGGKNTPAVGFGMGLERLLMVLAASNKFTGNPPAPELFIISTNDNITKYAFRIAKKLRDLGISVETDLMNRSLKAQLKCANKINAKYVIVLGDDEMTTNVVKLKNMQTGEEISLSLADIPCEMRSLLNSHF